MGETDSLIRLTKLYGEALGMELRTVSWRMFGDSKKLGAIVASADLSVRRRKSANDVAVGSPSIPVKPSAVRAPIGALPW
jgi:hypothetical protein